MKLGSRYHVVDEIARGGMGVVLLALQDNAESGAAPVAIKQIHAHLVDHPEIVASFMDEARIASRILHPNVVRVLDVEMIDNRELVIVMDYIEGTSLRDLIRAHEHGLPIPVVRRILVDTLNGLHAAHELTDEMGNRLDVVHRDVSPHNCLVGLNGVTYVADFGIAMAAGRIATTNTNGAVKGKLQYLSPEQVFRKPIDRRTDVFAAGLVAWEALVGRKLFDAGTEGETLAMIIREPIQPPSAHRFDVPLDLDETVLRALERTPERRFASAEEFARAIAEGGPMAEPEEVAALVFQQAGAQLEERRLRFAAIASSPMIPVPPGEILVPEDGTKTQITGSGPYAVPVPRGHHAETTVLVRRNKTLSPLGVFVIAAICVSGGLLVGFSMRGKSDAEKFDGFGPIQPMSAPLPMATPTLITTTVTTMTAAPHPIPSSTPTATGTVIGATPVVDPPPTPTPTIELPATPNTSTPGPAARPTAHRPTPPPTPPAAKRDAGSGSGASHSGKPFIPDDL